MTSGEFITEHILNKYKLTVSQLAKELDIEVDVLGAVVSDQISIPIEWIFKFSTRFNFPARVLLATLK